MKTAQQPKTGTPGAQTSNNKRLVYGPQDLTKIYQQMCGYAHAAITFTREIVGGAPADEPGVRAFVQHRMQIPEGPNFEKAVQRILSEEMNSGEKLTVEQEPEDGSSSEELKDLIERYTYGLSVFRRSPIGVWIGDWQVKACFKSACTRVGLFKRIRFSKGSVVEMGQVESCGISRLESAHPERIYLMTTNGNGGPEPVMTTFRTFKGRISGPSGSASIVAHKECAAKGTMIEFSYRWRDDVIPRAEIAKVFAAANVIGLGSAKSYELGKFQCDRLTVECSR